MGRNICPSFLPSFHPSSLDLHLYCFSCHLFHMPKIFHLYSSYLRTPLAWGDLIHTYDFKPMTPKSTPRPVLHPEIQGPMQGTPRDCKPTFLKSDSSPSFPSSLLLLPQARIPGTIPRATPRPSPPSLLTAGRPGNVPFSPTQLTLHFSPSVFLDPEDSGFLEVLLTSPEALQKPICLKAATKNVQTQT